MGVRKNAKFLSAAEKENFVKACVLMKAQIVNPAAPAAQQYSKWDEYVAIHWMIQDAFAPGDSSVNFGHGGNGSYRRLLLPRSRRPVTKPRSRDGRRAWSLAIDGPWTRGYARTLHPHPDNDGRPAAEGNGSANGRGERQRHQGQETARSLEASSVMTREDTCPSQA
jgi:hypothetical protein